tara:strand:- start:122 stop:388 length:267 start_codon:yes stop_codon:yes gene_type:complete
MKKGHEYPDWQLATDGLWQVCPACELKFICGDKMQVQEIPRQWGAAGSQFIKIIDGYGLAVYFGCSCGAQWAWYSPNLLVPLAAESRT